MASRKRNQNIQPTPEKKKISSLTAFVVFSISMLIIYTIVDKIIFLKIGLTDPTLTTAFFGFFGGEVVTCAIIKIFKIKREPTSY